MDSPFIAALSTIIAGISTAMLGGTVFYFGRMIRTRLKTQDRAHLHDTAMILDALRIYGAELNTGPLFFQAWFDDIGIQIRRRSRVLDRLLYGEIRVINDADLQDPRYRTWTSDTIEELLDFDAEHIHTPLFGIVHQQGGVYRFNPIGIPWPEVTVTNRVGNLLMDAAHNQRPEMWEGLPLNIIGWMFVGGASVLNSPDPISEGLIADHPDRLKVRVSKYMDAETGTLTYRITGRLPEPELDVLECPENGWDPDINGMVPAAMYLFCQASKGKTPAAAQPEEDPAS